MKINNEQLKIIKKAEELFNKKKPHIKNYTIYFDDHVIFYDPNDKTTWITILYEENNIKRTTTYSYILLKPLIEKETTDNE